MSGSGSRRGWWIAAALVAVAVVIDVVDGARLKLATSVLLLAGCLIAAVARPPWSMPVKGAVIGCLAGALALVAYRLVGPGL